MNQNSLILSLIRDDLINSKLVYSLEAIGLKADDYLLHLAETILELMGFESTDELMEYYLQLTFPIRDINIFERAGTLEQFATTIYSRLQIYKNEQLITTDGPHTAVGRND
jgi:hypothetical protein